MKSGISASSLNDKSGFSRGFLYFLSDLSVVRMQKKVIAERSFFLPCTCARNNDKERVFAGDNNIN